MTTAETSGTPTPAYEGEGGFVFVCYSHEDSDSVYQAISILTDADVNVWYDEGIRPGAEWTDELANAITNCDRFLFFATPRSVDSRHCRNEIQFAINCDKEILVVYLEATQLTPGLELALGWRQALIRSQLDESTYARRLVAAVSASSDSDDMAKSGPTGTRGVVTRRWGRRAVAWIAVLGVVLSGVLYWILGARTPLRASGQSTSIAMLPLQNLGGFADDTYFPDSFSEDLLNRLVSVEGLSVVSRRASFGFRETPGNRIDLAEVAVTLGVRNILSGYVRKVQDSLHLSLELVEVKDDLPTIRWSKRYEDRPMSEVLAIQAEVTRLVASEFFPGGLSDETRVRVANHSTDNVEAYNSYLEARGILRKPLNAALIDRAAALFDAAVALDPEFAWARAGLCSTYTLEYRREGTFANATNACEALTGYAVELFEVRLALGEYLVEIGETERAVTELQGAVQLNPNSADARIGLARSLAARFTANNTELDRVRAEEAYLEGIALEPTYWFAHHAYASYLISRGELDEAQRQLERSLELEPDNPSTSNNLANVLFRKGENDAAVLIWNAVLEKDAGNRWAHSGLGILHHYDREFSKAIDHFRSAIDAAGADHQLWGRLGESARLLPDRQVESQKAFGEAIALARESLQFDPRDWQTKGYIALYSAYLGDFETAEASLKEMFALNSSREPMTHYWAALIAYEQGELERTFAELEQALRSGFDQQKKFIADEPALDALRAEAPERFDALIRRF